MSTVAANPDIAAIDAALAKGVWWPRPFDDLSEHGVRRAEALDRRLAVDPALVDLDDLPLRETVMRICADLGITPDWSHWAAGDWMVSDPPADGAPRQAVPAPPRKGLARSVIQGLSAPIVQPPETAISLALQAGPFAPPWLPPRPG